MSNPTGRTGKRLVEKTATGTRVFYHTADGKPSRTLDITPKGSKYFATATKREIEQAGGKVTKRTVKKAAPKTAKKPAAKGGAYYVRLKTGKGVRILGPAKSYDGALDIFVREFDRLPKQDQESSRFEVFRK